MIPSSFEINEFVVKGKKDMSIFGLDSILVFFVILSFCLLPGTALSQNIISKYEISDEIKISSEDKCCDYSSEDYRRLLNIEYPKLIIRKQKKPIVAFMDVKNDKVVFVEIDGKTPGVRSRIAPLEKNKIYDNRWPIIYLKHDEIWLASMNWEFDVSTGKEIGYHIQVHALNLEENSLSQRQDIKVSSKILSKIGGGAVLTGVYPLNRDASKYMLAGDFTEMHFHPLAIFSGEFPQFYKNFSMIWDGNKVGRAQEIEKKGWFGAHHRVYSVTESGTLHAAWERDESYSGKSKKRNVDVVYSRNKDGAGWSEPLVVYEMKDTEAIFPVMDLDIEGDDRHAYLVWEEPYKGVFFAEIKDGAVSEMTNLIKKEDMKLKGRGGLLGEAVSSKIITDKNGNVFLLWANNGLAEIRAWQPEQHELLLLRRIEGKWMPPIKVSSGRGNIIFPDMTIDETGKLHLAYIRGDRNENATCYYRSLTPMSE